MSGCLDNDCPPRPDGVGDMRTPDQGTSGGGIVPFGTPTGEKPTEKRLVLSVTSGLFFCALGGAVAAAGFSLLAPAFVAYGLVSCAVCGGLREKVLAAVAALVPAVALSLSDGASVVAASVVVCLVGLVSAGLLVREEMTPGVGCVVVALAAAAQLGAESLVALSQGTTLAAGVESLFDAYLQQLGGISSLELAAQVSSIKALLSVLWPAAYVLSALGAFLVAHVGVWLAAGRAGEKAPKLPKMVDYDLPLWVVAVFVLAAAALAVTLTVPAASSQVVLMVAANVVVAVRFALAAQGLAVLTWFVREKHFRPLTACLLGMAALYLEVQFFVLTVVGLVDVWTNFRHLQRGEKPGSDAATAAKQD